MSTGNPPAGYYADPSVPGYIRYWDGNEWVAGTSRPAPDEVADQVLASSQSDAGSSPGGAHAGAAAEQEQAQSGAWRPESGGAVQGAAPQDAARRARPRAYAQPLSSSQSQEQAQPLSSSQSLSSSQAQGQSQAQQQVPAQQYASAQQAPAQFQPQQYAQPQQVPAQQPVVQQPVVQAVAQPAVQQPAVQQPVAQPAVQQPAVQPVAQPVPVAAQPQPQQYASPPQQFQQPRVPAQAPQPAAESANVAPQIPESVATMVVPSAITGTYKFAGANPFAGLPGSPSAPEVRRGEESEVETTVVELASPGSRILARIIDTGIAAVFSAPVTGALLLFAHRHDHQYVLKLESQATTTYTTLGMDALGIALWAAALLTVIIVSIVLEGFRLGKGGQSYGKRLAGIRVVRMPDGAPLGRRGPGTRRTLLFWAFAVIPVLDVFALGSVLWGRPFRQGMHEKATSTVSVKA